MTNSATECRRPSSPLRMCRVMTRWILAALACVATFVAAFPCFLWLLHIFCLGDLAEHYGGTSLSSLVNAILFLSLGLPLALLVTLSLVVAAIVRGDRVARRTRCALALILILAMSGLILLTLTWHSWRILGTEYANCR